MFPWEILSCLSSTIGKVLLALLLAKLWARLTVVMCREDTRMDGKVGTTLPDFGIATVRGVAEETESPPSQVVLITGGSAGIGFETARDLADRGAEVVFTARDMKKVDTKRITEKKKIWENNGQTIPV